MASYSKWQKKQEDVLNFLKSTSTLCSFSPAACDQMLAFKFLGPWMYTSKTHSWCPTSFWWRRWYRQLLAGRRTQIHHWIWASHTCSGSGFDRNSPWLSFAVAVRKVVNAVKWGVGETRSARFSMLQPEAPGIMVVAWTDKADLFDISTWASLTFKRYLLGVYFYVQV